jgi:alanine racemase
VSTVARSLHLSAPQAAGLEASAEDAAVDDFLASLSAAPPRLDAELLATKRVGAGAGVSYGHTFRTSVDTTLGLVAIGYGHGIPRKAGNRAAVTWHGAPTRVPIVGRVAMDVLVVDLSDLPAEPGERVVFFGDPERGEISLPEWGDSVGEHPFAVVSCLDDRVTRVIEG